MSDRGGFGGARKRNWPAGPLVVLFFAGILLLTFWRVIFHGEFTLLVGGDMLAQTYPWFNAAGHWLKRGVLLLWDPFVYAGKANLGELQPGILYPLNWVFQLLPAGGAGINTTGLEFLLILHCLLACCFTYLLGRSLGLGFAGAAAAGILYGLGGFMTQLAGFMNIYSSFAWMPLAVLLFRRALAAGSWKGGWPSLAGCSVVFALSFLAGHHAAAIHAGLLAALYAVFFAFCEGRAAAWRRAGSAAAGLACVAILAGMLAAVQILPSAEWGKRVWRWIGDGEPVRWGDAIPHSVLEHTGNLQPQDLASLLFPHMSGGLSLYAGAVAVFLIVAGLLFARGWEGRYFGLASAFYFFACLGPFAAVHGWINTFLPGVWFAREVYLYLVPLQLCLAVVAGFGLDHIVRSYSGDPDPNVKHLVVRAGWGMAVLAPVFAVIAVAAHLIGGIPWDHTHVRSAFGLAVQLLALGLLLFLLHTGKAGARLFSGLLLALLVLDLASNYSLRIRDTSGPGSAPDVRERWEMPPEAHFLKELRSGEYFRVDDPTEVFPRNFGDAWLLEETLGHGATARVDYLEFRGTGWEPASNASALLNARYFMSRLPVHWMEKVYGEEAAVYRNPRALPRAFAVDRFRVFPDERQLLSWLANPVFAPGETALLLAEEAERARGFLSGLQDESEGLRILDPGFWSSWQQEAEREQDEDRKAERYRLHAPWGWEGEDGVRLKLIPETPAEECYIVLNYFPSGGGECRLPVRMQAPDHTSEHTVTLAGGAGESGAWRPRRAFAGIGPLQAREYLVSFSRTADCGARIDSIRFTRRPPAADDPGPGQVSITSWRPNRVRLKAALSRPSLVILSETNYPGWVAEVDGVAAPVLWVNHLLRAVPVPAGEHEITLRFRSRTFLWGLALSLATLALMLIALRRFR